ncbi:NYN domain-containing protein [Baekduia sp. Peel2402]|uniref:NYN domain-containing protein n=1 Tax=Baekduia sp. Peel2402 TaxID=3458296 RepID=UPI00403E7B1B
MRWLVDGMNVIGSRPDGWWRDRAGAMARLAADLDAWAAARPDDTVAVVFDGRERDVGALAHVDVGWAPGGRNAADDVIAERVEDDADPGSLTVVTSDRELAARVRARGASVEGARAFRARLYPDD